MKGNGMQLAEHTLRTEQPAETVPGYYQHTPLLSFGQGPYRTDVMPQDLEPDTQPRPPQVYESGGGFAMGAVCGAVVMFVGLAILWLIFG